MRGPCETCGEEVVLADALITTMPGVGVETIPVEPEPLPPTDDLLLFVGINAKTGRWLVTPLGNPSASNVLRVLLEPHAHRAHVCDQVPADWADIRQAVPA